jgi:hypothetical protein
MLRQKHFRIVFAIACLAIGGLIFVGPVAAASALKPNPPVTGRYSVKAFVGDTKLCFLTVYAPQTYVDGTPIPAGVDMKVAVYRSYDGGKTYGEKGVKVVKQEFVSFRNPETGQNRFDPAHADWINVVCETPVAAPRTDTVTLLGVPADGRAVPDTTVFLSATVIVDGVQSDATNRYLTFRYAVSGIPGLVRYETPDTTAQPVPTQLSHAPSVALADRGGVWKGTYRLTAITVMPALTKSPEYRSEGCQQALAQFEQAKDKELPMVLKVTSITDEGMPVPKHRTIYPGTSEVQLASLNDPNKMQTMKPDLVYHKDRSLVILTSITPQGSIEFVGDLVENATEYQIEGPFRMKMEKDGQTLLIIHGMWNVRRIK